MNDRGALMKPNTMLPALRSNYLVRGERILGIPREEPAPEHEGRSGQDDQASEDKPAVYPYCSRRPERARLPSLSVTRAGIRRARIGGTPGSGSKRTRSVSKRPGLKCPCAGSAMNHLPATPKARPACPSRRTGPRGTCDCRPACPRLLAMLPSPLS